MASGNQTYNGNCADLPVAPTNNSKVMMVTVSSGMCLACAAISPNDSECAPPPRFQKSRNIPNRKPMSPMRLTTNAFLPALALASLSYQKPMSRYEHMPTPSQPTNNNGRLSASTNVSIEKVNRFRYVK